MTVKYLAVVLQHLPPHAGNLSPPYFVQIFVRNFPQAPRCNSYDIIHPEISHIYIYIYIYIYITIKKTHVHLRAILKLSEQLQM